MVAPSELGNYQSHAEVDGATFISAEVSNVEFPPYRATRTKEIRGAVTITACDYLVVRELLIGVEYILLNVIYNGRGRL